MKIINCWRLFGIRKSVSLGCGQYETCLKFSSYLKFKRPESKLITMKLDTPQFRAIFTPEVSKLSELFQKYGYGLRLAGGAVRDLLMNKQPEDIDFATTATPDQMKQMFTTEGVRMLHRKGEVHGTVTIRINDQQNFEITTLRIDMRTDGRHAEVEFTTDWELDAGRRDLTINAMFLGLDGTLYDYFNGKDDLEKRVVRFVGEPEGRIKEDYLRILRYFRFYGRIALNPNDHDIHTLEAIRNNAEGLSQISGERLWMELKKILSGNFAKELILQMIDSGIGPFIGLPQNPNVQEYENVCNRSQVMKPHPVTRLTALLKTEEEVLALHSRLKFSKYDKELSLFIINNRDRSDMTIKPFLEIIINSKYKTSDVREWSCEVLKYHGNVCLWKELNDWKIPKFPLSGHTLKEKGYTAGPKMSKVMNTLKTVWLESNFKMTKEELLDYLEKTQLEDEL